MSKALHLMSLPPCNLVTKSFNCQFMNIEQWMAGTTWLCTEEESVCQLMPSNLWIESWWGAQRENLVQSETRGMQDIETLEVVRSTELDLFVPYLFKFCIVRIICMNLYWLFWSHTRMSGQINWMLHKPYTSLHNVAGVNGPPLANNKCARMRKELLQSNKIAMWSEGLN